MKANFWFIFLEKSRLTYLLLLGVLVVGAFSIFNLNIESNPEINQPLGIVQTFYPNASAVDVERNITEVLEQEFQNLSNVKQITSTSRNNFSSITVEFETGSDVDEVISDLERSTNNASRKLPSQAESPTVFELDFNNQSIVSLSVVGTDDFKELTQLAENIAEDIKSISGVSNVDIIGGYSEEVVIVLDSLVSEFYGISPAQIVQVIQGGNLNLPVGEITKNEESINVRLKGEISSLGDISSLPLTSLSEAGNNSLQILTIGDVARVEINPIDQKSLSFVSDGQSKASRAVTLNVFKSKGGNIVNIVNQVDEKVADIKLDLDENFDIIKTNDNALFIRNDLNTLSSSGVQTILVIFLAIFLVLSFKEALVASIAIPLIFLITFATLYLSGETLNGLTIFSLILSLGLIVDTSIVMIEGIYEFKKEGKDSITAAKDTLNQYKWPLIAGTLTTLSAFAPMLLVSGIVGAFIRTIPIVLSITLIASLVVSFAITPILSVQLIEVFEKMKSEKRKGLSWKEKLFEKIKDFYEFSLRNILNSRIIRLGIMVVTLIAFGFSLSLPVSGMLKTQLFPEGDVPFVYINFESKLGTSLENTLQQASVIEDLLLGKNYVKNYTLNLGSKINSSPGEGSGASQSNLGHVVVNLIDDAELRNKSFEINSELRSSFEELNSDLDITVESISAGPPTSAPLEVRLSGPELDKLKEIAEMIKLKLEEVEGLVNISSDFDEDTIELELLLNEEIINYYGLNKATVAQNLQGLVTGIEAGEVRIDGDTLDVRVWLDDTSKKSDFSLESTLIPTRNGFIPISNLGSFVENRSLQVIPRIDQKRSVRVRAFTDDGVVISTLLDKINDKILSIELPLDYNINLGGEDEDVQQSFQELFSSMIIAVLLIIIILVTQFNSFRQTFIILFTLPLAIIGIFPGLTLLGLPLSFPAFLGVVMLTGIVVNDAIVMVDQINKNRLEENMELKEAIIKACRQRFVPIMLTTITTIFGLLPITISDEFWRGLGFSVIFGLTTATFLTLIIIPVLFTIFLKDKSKNQHQLNLETNDNISNSTNITKN